MYRGFPAAYTCSRPAAITTRSGRDRTSTARPWRCSHAFYEVVLLDLGTGLVGPLARFAARRADQLILVTTPERVASIAALDALALLHHRERTTVAVNRERAGAADAVELCLLAEHPHDVVTIPDDERLAAMLETSTYTLGALRPQTRTAIKRLGLAVAEQLV